MKTKQTTPTATLIQCGTRAFCLRLSNGGDAAGAYLSEESARAAAERRGWTINAVERHTLTDYLTRRLERAGQKQTMEAISG